MRLDKLDLNLLVALDAMLECRNISEAARQLQLSQPALSGALARLRAFFDDELLVQMGRQMKPTPKAEELAEPIREILMLVRSRITTPSSFDPAKAERGFRIVASDYAYDVCVGPALRNAALLAPRVRFELTSPGDGSLDRLEHGEIDLFISVSSYLSANHPIAHLYDDDHAVLAWKEHPEIGDALDEATFLRLGHVAVRFGNRNSRSFTEDFFSKMGFHRRIEVTVPAFGSVPVSLIGSRRIATVARRHAEFYLNLFPLKILELPVPLPGIRVDVQWHSSRDRDEGMRWLVDLLTAEGRAMSRPDSSGGTSS